MERTYQSKSGEEKTKMSITFNPFLKTKLIGVLGPSFLRSANERYRAIYDNYKHRMEHHAVYGLVRDGIKDDNGRVVASKGHRHNMAIRYMVKQFLLDLYCEWRRIEGLPPTQTYAEAKLKIAHSA